MMRKSRALAQAIYREKKKILQESSSTNGSSPITPRRKYVRYVAGCLVNGTVCLYVLVDRPYCSTGTGTG
jgi:hypothetical protein